MNEKFWNEDEWDSVDNTMQPELGHLMQYTHSSSLDNVDRKNAQVRPQSLGAANAQSYTSMRPMVHQATASPMPQVSATGMPFLLIGLEAICNAVGAGPRTVKRWMAVDGFPARRCSDGVYRADPHSVRRWFANV